MPTSRARHTLTETDELRGVLDRASRLFPGVGSRTGLLQAVVRLGDDELKRRLSEVEERETVRRDRLQYLADVSTGRQRGLDFEALGAIRHREDG